MKNQEFAVRNGDEVVQLMRDHNYAGCFVINEIGNDEHKVFGPLTKGAAEKLYKQVSERKLNNGDVWLLRGLAVLREEGKYIDRHLQGYAV